MGVRRTFRQIDRLLSQLGTPGVQAPGDPILRRTLIPNPIATNTGITVRRNDGSPVGPRTQLNFIEGAGITITVADDAGTPEIDITISAETPIWWSFEPGAQWGRRGMFGTAGTSASLFTEGILDQGGNPAFAGSSSSYVVDTTGVWGRGTVSAAAGAGTIFGPPAHSGADGAAQRQLLPYWKCRMRTGVASTSIAGARFWFGLSNATAGAGAPDAGVNINTLHAAGFRFFPTVGDSNWQAVSGNATAVTGQTTDTGVTVAASNTVYEFILDFSTAGTIRYYINNSLVHTESTVLPGNTTDMGIVNTGRQVTTGTARSVDWQGDNIVFTV